MSTVFFDLTCDDCDLSALSYSGEDDCAFCGSNNLRLASSEELERGKPDAPRMSHCKGCGAVQIAIWDEYVDRYIPTLKGVCSNCESADLEKTSIVSATEWLRSASDKAASRFWHTVPAHADDAWLGRLEEQVVSGWTRPVTTW